MRHKEFLFAEPSRLFGRRGSRFRGTKSIKVHFLQKL
jgi:hypothetical protein